MDPKWIEQRDRSQSEKRDQEEVFAAGSSIGSQLQRLAERRTDIFGSGAEETQIGKKVSTHTITVQLLGVQLSGYLWILDLCIDYNRYSDNEGIE